VAGTCLRVEFAESRTLVWDRNLDLNLLPSNDLLGELYGIRLRLRTNNVNSPMSMMPANKTSCRIYATSLLATFLIIGL